MTIDLRLGDCLEVMPSLPDGSVDAIITDLPYGTTQCKWDVIIPVEPMWYQVERLLKPTGAFITTASQPFTSILVCSNIYLFKFEDIWHKTHARSHLNCKIMPLREHENILVFGKRIIYNPQMRKKPLENIRGFSKTRTTTDSYGKFDVGNHRTISDDMSYPRSVIHIGNPNGKERGFHPTQKPVALYEYLIKTYTNEGGMVLDFCMGSGTTGVACVKTLRNFIGIEIRPDYFEIAKQRIADAGLQYSMTLR